MTLISSPASCIAESARVDPFISETDGLHSALDSNGGGESEQKDVIGVVVPVVVVLTEI